VYGTDKLGRQIKIFFSLFQFKIGIRHQRNYKYKIIKVANCGKGRVVTTLWMDHFGKFGKFLFDDLPILNL